MKPDLQKGMRTQVAQALPHALETAIQSYQRFAERRIDEDAKEFKAHHDACKVAIAHIELLIKLTNWAEITPDGAEADTQIAAINAMIANAQKEIKANEKRH